MTPPPGHWRVRRPLGAASPLGRMAQRAATSPAFVRFGPRLMPRLDRAAHRLTRGRVLLSQFLLPVLLLTTTGQRTGRPRVVPLATLPEPDGSFLVVGSNWGRPAHPAWSTNLLCRPEAVVHFDGRARPVVAHLLEGPERDAAWPRLLSLWPVYDAYAGSSRRELRVFRLVPRPSTADLPEMGAVPRSVGSGQPGGYGASRPAAAADTRPRE